MYEIVSESEECREAATQLGRPYVGVIIEDDSRPSGCYYWESTPGAYNKNVYLNPYSRSDTHNINRMTGGVCKKGISDIYKYALYKQTSNNKRSMINVPSLFVGNQCFTSNTNCNPFPGLSSCCPGGDGQSAECSTLDCSSPGVTPCEGTWMVTNCEAVCFPCTGISS